jgi:hypothetical protein
MEDKELSFQDFQDFERKHFDGPFLFSDYWASVLNLRGIVNLETLSTVGVSLEAFRKFLNRPSAGLPRFGYLILYVLLKPFLVLYSLLRQLVGVKPSKEMHIADDSPSEMERLMIDYSLRIKPKEGGLADVYSGVSRLASGVVNPLRLVGSNSMFFARYKVFLASLIVLGYAALINLVTRILHAEPVAGYLGVLNYPVVLLILWALFDDLLTATISPLPIIAIRIIVREAQGFQGVVIAIVLTAFILYLVEWFFIPRSLPPALYFYVNDGRRPNLHYKEGHEPYWLEGEYYWVWRYVHLAPAELLKFWEKDWERLEIWIRADGENRGRLEYIVTDFHYRELWFGYEGFTRKKARDYHEALLTRHVDTSDRLTWLVEVDMDVVFHTPSIKGVYLTRGGRLSLGRRVLSVLTVMWNRPVKENPDGYKRSLERFEIEGAGFLEDVPEHFRTMVTRQLLSLPWTYWRFPRGVKSARQLLLYSSAGEQTGPEPTSDRTFQIKEPGLRKEPGAVPRAQSVFRI